MRKFSVTSTFMETPGCARSDARQQNVVAGIDLEAPARIDATSEEALFQHRRADRHRIGGERLGSIQRQVARLLIEQDPALPGSDRGSGRAADRKSTRLNSSH